MQDQPQTLEPSRSEIERLRQENKFLQQQLNTYKKQNQQLQNQWLEELQHKFDFDPNAIFVATDAKGVITYVNKNFCELSKYSSNELIGHTHRIVNSGYHPNSFFADMWQTITTGKVWQGEIKNKAKDGSFYSIKLAIYPLINENDFPLQYIAVRTDQSTFVNVNERINSLYKEAQAANEELQASEEELRQMLDQSQELNERLTASESKYRLISESMQDMVCLHTLEGVYTYVSPSSKRLLGYEPAELLGKNPYDYFHPEDIDRIRKDAHSKSLSGIAGNNIEYRFRQKSGQYIWLETITEPLLDENGKLYGLHTSSRDITKRIKIQKERDNFFNYSLDMMVICSYEGIMLETNFAWINILGYSIEETFGKHIGTFIHPDYKQIALQVVGESIRNATVIVDLEVKQPCKDGSYRWISWNAVPFPEEKVIYCFGRDITQLKHSEEAAKLAEFSINHASDSVFWIGSDASILRVNKTACRMLGYSEEELLRMKVADTDPNYSDEIWPVHWKELREKKNMIFESLHRTKDGRIVPTEVSVNYLEYNGREYNFAFAREITDRKKAEEQLRFNSLILSRVNDAIVGVDMQYHVNFWSESAERQYGLKAEDILGKHLTTAYRFTWINPEDEAATSVALAAQGYCNFEVVQTLNNGNKLYVEMFVQHLTDLNGNKIGLFSVIHDITERKQGEQQLLKREMMLESIFNESTDALFLVAPDGGKILKSNKRAVELFETGTEQELIGRFGPSFHKIPFTEKDMQLKEECIAREGEWSSEIEYISMQGNSFWGNITVKLIQIVDQAFHLVRITDITSRKQAQADLLQYAQRSITILESITDAMFIVDHHWQFTYFNKRAEKVLGIKREDVLHKSLWDLYPTAIGTAFERQYYKALQENTDVHFEEYFPVLNIWFEMHVYPSSEGLSVYFRNINARKAAEKALQQSEEKFRSLTTHSPVGICTVTPTGSCTWLNPRLQSIGGFTFEEGLGSGWIKYVHPDDLPQIKATWKNQAVTGQSLMNEYRYVHKDGNIRWARSTINPVFSDTGERTSYVCIIEDITERRQAEEKLKNTLDELKRRNHELDNYVYKVSHDLRAPLTSIMGLINLIKIEPDQDAIRRYIDLIENRVIKSDQFIHSILSHSKILNSEVQISPVDFRQIILDSFDQLKYMPNSDRLQVQVHVEGNSEFWSDAFRMDIILKNFTSNAIKYLNPHQPENYIYFDITITQEEGVIIIRDNGLGIDKQYQSKIFDMFFRATEKSEGSGLGLYIVKQTIERMGGSIKMESEMGKGTTFTLVLPNLK